MGENVIRVSPRCSDCRHCAKSQWLRIGLSGKVLTTTIPDDMTPFICLRSPADVVSGNATRSCREMRAGGRDCGPSGKLFEPIPPEPNKRTLWRRITRAFRIGRG